MALENLAIKAVGIGVALVLLHLTITYFTSPIKSLPGPFLARLTNLWRFYDYWSCNQINSHQKLHKEHGPAVRIGPNMVSLSDPELIKLVYSTRGDFVKVGTLIQPEIGTIELTRYHRATSTKWPTLARRASASKMSLAREATSSTPET